MIKEYIVFDCETQKLSDDVPGGWKNVFGMGLASAVTYNSKTDMYLFWDKDHREDLCKYLNGKLIVSFNAISFDSKLLLGDSRVIEPNGITRNEKYQWHNADIYAEIWRNILSIDRNSYPELMLAIRKQRFEKHVFDLHSVSAATIGHTKSGDGALAPALFQAGEIFKLLEYNLQDVRCTRELFEFILKYKYCVNGNHDIIQFR